MRDLAHAGHGAAQKLDFAGGEVLEHLRRAVFAQRHQ